MAILFDRLTSKKEKDIRILTNFVDIYCGQKHRSKERLAFPITDNRLRQVLDNKEPVLCDNCTKLLNHGMAKLLLCTQDPKPMCKHCEVHCYAPGYREQIKEVMKFSGLYLVKHGRLDLLAHYIL